MIDGVIALYIFMLAAFTGYEVISRVPVDSTLLRVIGFVGVVLAAGNAVGGYVVTERMLKMFVTSGKKK
jgi:H+-translocating NAD(P) transhydrogenase subunit alpha